MYAVSNKCTHLNVSLVGKTAFLQGKVRLRAPTSPLVTLPGTVCAPAPAARCRTRCYVECERDACQLPCAG